MSLVLNAFVGERSDRIDERQQNSIIFVQCYDALYIPFLYDTKDPDQHFPLRHPSSSVSFHLFFPSRFPLILHHTFHTGTSVCLKTFMELIVFELWSILFSGAADSQDEQGG